MQRLFLTPLVIASLLFLPSCSNAEAQLCEAAKLDRKNFQTEGLSLEREADQRNWKTPEGTLIEFEKTTRLGNLAIKAKLNSRKVIINNPDCFTPREVVVAQNYIKYWGVLDN